MRTLFNIGFATIVVYHLLGSTALYTSSYFNVSAYLTMPPLEYGEISIRRMPMIFGSKIAIFSLKHKSEEMANLAAEGKVSYLTILSAHKNVEELVDVTAFRERYLMIADIMVEAKIPLQACHLNKNIMDWLVEWEAFDEKNKLFLDHHFFGIYNQKC